MKKTLKTLLSTLLLVSIILTFVGCGENNNSSDNNKETIDNTPIKLTVDNVEEYLLIDVFSKNISSSKNGTGNGIWASYTNYYDIEANVSPLTDYYFDNVTVEIEWEIGYGFLSGDSTVKLNYSGEGTNSRSYSVDSGGQKYDTFMFKVTEYTIKSVTGQVYKENPKQ